MQTIVAIATPPGIGGVGVIRVSGPLAFDIASRLTNRSPSIKKIQVASFFDQNKSVIDKGVVLAFKGPHSFTGEDVIEFQAHGGPVVMDMLVAEILKAGARLAEPGEFSKRAFLNDKIDLLQAEAIADLIEAQSTHAARLAQGSLQGLFSEEINKLVEKLIALRIYVEAALDFPEEEIDFIGDEKVSNDLQSIRIQLETVLSQAKKGALIREGVDVVICGKPNAGKSTLMNQLSGEETAIVTPIPGTTRDVIKEKINLDGLVLHLSDTAGLRETDNIVEQEGVRRTKKAIQKGSLALLLIDGSEEENVKALIDEFKKEHDCAVLPIINKMDMTQKEVNGMPSDCIKISAKNGAGISDLMKAIKQKAGLSERQEEGAFLARRRHLEALEKAYALLLNGEYQLKAHKAGELLAEDLRLAQDILGDITGKFSSDDLLGRIFSSFCIGK
jgi:tRNA modification GTPase